MSTTIEPRLGILPASQMRLWPELEAVPANFVLYGGTGLALQIGHRFSEDFDFFSTFGFDPPPLPFFRNLDLATGRLDRVPESIRRDLTRWAQGVHLGKLPAFRPQDGLAPGLDGALTLQLPHPADLVRVARKVVWYDRPEQTLADLNTFLAHLMVYGSPTDVMVTRQYVPADEFRRVLENAPAGLFYKGRWEKWHEQLGMPVQSLPRRRFPDGSFGPEPGTFFGK